MAETRELRNCSWVVKLETMIYHPYQFMKVNLHELELVRCLALQNFGSKEQQRLDLLYFQCVVEDYLKCELNY